MQNDIFKNNIFRNGCTKETSEEKITKEYVEENVRFQILH